MGRAQKQRWFKSKGNPKTQHFESLPFERSLLPVLHRFMKSASQTSWFVVSLYGSKYFSEGIIWWHQLLR